MAPPDANLHPVATGRAAETVSQHQNPQDLTFYSAWFCPFSQRLREFPTIEYGGKAIYESLVLLEFLEDAYPSYKPNLPPSDPSDRAHQRIWIDHIAKAVVPAQTNRRSWKQREMSFMRHSESCRTRSRDLTLPESDSLVDIVIAPWILRDYVSAEHRAFKREDNYEYKSPWIEEFMHGIHGVVQERDKAKVIYNRYLRGDAHSEAVKAVKAGRPIP
ncbi:hypothetical protein F5J12DRAFT_912912 [Pisolithus orientalis]|uniref:uncharacterized protein n=1 Tax=Pisolithus orientalis TaxID=936130 RepID=UPI0022256696|nr:uncharacterized protein F5J12DRAFT_912912 [Pisolithus orientalis]KAI6007593.1 hypothetical protein F5J12DRAFT_912912 [Pisolithus orientalis]